MPLREMTDSGRLIDVVPLIRERHADAGTDLVVLPEAKCPDCRAPLIRDSLWQDSLVRHGGYGGTQRVDTDWCGQCGFERVVAVATERPPR